MVPFSEPFTVSVDDAGGTKKLKGCKGVVPPNFPTGANAETVGFDGVVELPPLLKVSTYLRIKKFSKT